MKSFVIADPSKCIGCGACEIACASANSGMKIPEAARMRAEFNSRLNLVFAPQVTMPVQCRQCEDAPCAQVCPVEGIVIRDGVVHVQREKCVGCKMCMAACPFGAVAILQRGTTNENLPEFYAHKCELCTDRAAGPACIQICPADAFVLINENAIKDVVRNRRKKALQSLI